MFTLGYLLKKIIFSICLFSLASNLFAEQRDSVKHKVYHVKYHIDIPVTVVAAATNFWGLSIVSSKPALDSLTIIGLDANNINRFDRSATRKNADFAPTARTISDFGMYGSYALPLLLLADKKIRQDWGDLLVLFLETQATVGNLYSWGAAVHIDRIRPMAYHPDVPWDQRTDYRNRNSFYSGHTSSSASASFFVAKVYCDYHPELGNKKYLFYSLALIPPVFTGFFRYQGMKHYPTDTLVGLMVGASTGILIPHLHKISKSKLTVVPFRGQVNGLALSLSF